MLMLKEKSVNYPKRWNQGPDFEEVWTTMDFEDDKLPEPFSIPRGLDCSLSYHNQEQA
jgi:hypothetical protein